MAIRITKTEALVVYECADCGISFGMPDAYDDRRREDGRSFYCPNGHSLSYSNAVGSELAKLKKQLAREIGMRDQLEAANTNLQRSLSASKGQMTKLKNRVSKGVCPCCNRSFTNLGRHMTTKHPDWKTE